MTRSDEVEEMRLLRKLETTVREIVESLPATRGAALRNVMDGLDQLRGKKKS